MPKRLVFIAVSVAVLLAVALLGLYFLSVGGRLSRQTYPPSSNYALLSIHELKQGDHPSGSLYNTEGYVAKDICLPFLSPRSGVCALYGRTYRDLRTKQDPGHRAPHRPGFSCFRQLP